MHSAPAPETGNQAAEPVAEKTGGSLLTGLTIEEPAATEPASPSSKEAPADVKPTRKPFMAQMPKELQENETLNRFNSYGEMGQAYLELTGKLGKTIAVPGEGATAEELNAYYKKIGRPETAELYSFTKKDLPEGLEYDEESEASFKAKAHEAGLTQAQAETLFQWQTDATVQSNQDRQADLKQKATETVAELRKVYGSKTGEEIALTARFMKTVANKVDPNLLRDIERSGLGNSAALLKMMNIFAHKTGEDGFVGEGAGNEDEHPGRFSYPGLV